MSREILLGSIFIGLFFSVSGLAQNVPLSTPTKLHDLCALGINTGSLVVPSIPNQQPANLCFDPNNETAKLQRELQALKDKKSAAGETSHKAFEAKENSILAQLKSIRERKKAMARCYASAPFKHKQLWLVLEKKFPTYYDVDCFSTPDASEDGKRLAAKILERKRAKKAVEARSLSELRSKQTEQDPSLNDRGGPLPAGGAAY